MEVDIQFLKTVNYNSILIYSSVNNSIEESDPQTNDKYFL